MDFGHLAFTVFEVPGFPTHQHFSPVRKLHARVYVSEIESLDETFCIGDLSPGVRKLVSTLVKSEAIRRSEDIIYVE